MLTPPAPAARRRPLRNLDAGALLEGFLVAGIAAILLILALLFPETVPRPAR